MQMKNVFSIHANQKQPIASKADPAFRWLQGQMNRTLLLIALLLTGGAGALQAQLYKQQTQEVNVVYNESNGLYGCKATYAITFGFENKKHVVFNTKLLKVDEITYNKKNYPYASLPADIQKMIQEYLGKTYSPKVYYSIYNNGQFLVSGDSYGMNEIQWKTVLKINSGNALNDFSEADTRSDEIWKAGQLSIKIDKTEIFPSMLFPSFANWLATKK